MKLTSLCFLVLSVCAVFAPSALAQREYASESGSWKFTCPEGWNPIGFAVIKHEEELMKADWPEKNFKYISGFTKGGMNTFVLPYILINKTEVDLSGAKFEDIEFGLNVDEPKTERELVLGNLVDQFTMGATRLEREKIRTVSVQEGPNEKGEQLRCTTYSYLGKSFIIQFECYDLVSSGDKNKVAFENFVNTFSFRDDSKFVPVADGVKSKYDASNYSNKPLNSRSNSASSSSSSGYRWRYGRFGIGGLVVVIVGAVIRIMVRD